MDSTLPNQQLKNRIFGAILLVILAVLLIPFFLGEPRSNIETPQQDNMAGFESKIQPLPQDHTNEAIATQTLEGDAADQAKKIDLDQPQAPREKTGAPKSVVKATPKATPKAPPKLEATAPAKKSTPLLTQGWALQAGVFSKKENAQAIAAILKKHDFRPNISPAAADFGAATRVWLGPYKNKAQAEKVSANLKSIIGNGGYIASYPFK